MTISNRIKHVVRAYPHLLWLLAIGSFLNIAAVSFLWPLNSIYITKVLGKEMTVAGLVLLLHSAGASIGQLTGGALFDRIGARPVILIGLLSASAVIALPGFIDNWPFYVAVMGLFGFTASLVGPAMYALAAKVWPEGGRRAFNFLYVANNIGVAVGTALGGIVASHSFRFAFLSASVLLLSFAVFAFFFIREDRFNAQAAQRGLTGQSAASDETAAASERIEPSAPWTPILALFVGCFTLWIVYVQWQSSLAVYMEDMGIELTAYSLLWTLNGLVIFLGQPLLTLTVRRFRSPASQMFLGIALFVIAFAILMVSQHYAFFVAGMIILTLGEMLLWPGIPAAVSQLSPPSRIGFFQGFIGSAATFGRMLGPLCGGLLYDHTTYMTLLIVMLSLLLIPTLCVVLYMRTGKKASC